MADQAPTFRTDYSPMRRYAPTGALLNKFGQQINSLTPGISASDCDGHGLGNRNIGKPPLIIGVAIITDDGDTQCSNNDEAPCGTDGRYLATFRYWDEQNNKYQNNPNVLLKIDANIYLPDDDPAPQQTRPKYVKGDLVPAMFDSNALWCVPLQSPPDETPTFSLISTANKKVNRSKDNIPELNNATQFSIWLLDKDNTRDEPYGAQAPDLVLVPNGVGQAVGGSNTIITILRDGDTILMKAGTSRHTRIDMHVRISGMQIRFIGRTLDNDLQPGLIDERDEFTQIDSWDFYSSDHAGRFGSPNIEPSGDGSIKVKTETEDEEWLAEITYWAEVIQDTVNGFVQIDIQSDSPGSEKQIGSLVDPNDQDLFDAIVIKGFDIGGGVQKAAEGDPTQRCWLLFDDRYDDPAMTGPDSRSIGEQKLIYGPCTYIGSKDFEGDDRPVYSCMRPEEEYRCNAESQNGTAAVGDSVTFILKDGKGRVSDVKRTALVAWNPLNKAKEAIMRRFQQQRIANQIVCG